MANPFLPHNEYVPDGEPHVFGDRVYLYGSHDSEGGERFCERDYVVYSASADDLQNWVYHGVSYKKSQDPRSRAGKLVDYYAPDCVRGNDGRYYLYYVAMGPNTKNFGPMSAAVSNKPEGPFEYLGDIRYKNGSPVLKFLTNDPAVINDNGKIYLYYGWGLGRDFRSKLFSPLYNLVQSKLFDRPVCEIKATKPSILSCAVTELEDDMLTVKYEPKAVLDSKTTADKNSGLYSHSFYEAPSIRKFGDLYYLIYSSCSNNELAYATSKYPDRGFAFQGTLISNCDIGYQGNKKRLAAGGTIHGSVEFINGEYYVFYHRCTHNTNFSRQACAEKIHMNPDGTFNQAELTTQGMGKPLPAKGKHPALLCCNLFTKKLKNVQGNGKGKSQPNITHNKGERFITAIANDTTIGFKCFAFDDVSKICVTVRGSAGEFKVLAGKNCVASIQLESSATWKCYEAFFSPQPGIHALYFVYSGKGTIDFIEFEMI